MKNYFFKKTSLTALMLLLIVTMTVLPVFAAVSIPKHDNYIADSAKLLSGSTIRNITTNNKALWEANGTTIAVCTVKTLDGEDLVDLARKVYAEWQMDDGVLIFIAKEENTFHLVQSQDIEEYITNADLEMIRDDYMETDFAAGNIDRAVINATTKLNTMMAGIPDPEANAVTEEQQPAEDNGTDQNTQENEGTTIGGVIVGFLKFILIAAMILLAAFILLFVAAMFNDDIAALMRKYIFQRGKASSVSSDFYDERLYGTNDRIQQRGRQNAARAQQNQNRPRTVQQQRPRPQAAIGAPGQNGYPRQQSYAQNVPSRQPQQQGYAQNGYSQQPQQGYAQNNYPRQTPQGYAQNNYPRQPQQNPPRQRPVMYNADGTVRRPRPAQQQAPRQAQTMDDGATRMFTIPHDSNNN